MGKLVNQPCNDLSLRPSRFSHPLIFSQKDMRCREAQWPQMAHGPCMDMREIMAVVFWPATRTSVAILILAASGPKAKVSMMHG